MSDYQRCQEQPSHRTKVEERSCFPAQGRTETNPLMGKTELSRFCVQTTEASLQPCRPVTRVAAGPRKKGRRNPRIEEEGNGYYLTKRRKEEGSKEIKPMRRPWPRAPEIAPGRRCAIVYRHRQRQPLIRSRGWHSGDVKLQCWRTTCSHMRPRSGAWTRLKSTGPGACKTVH